MPRFRRVVQRVGLVCARCVPAVVPAVVPKAKGCCSARQPWYVRWGGLTHSLACPQASVTLKTGCFLVYYIYSNINNAASPEGTECVCRAERGVQGWACYTRSDILWTDLALLPFPIGRRAHAILSPRDRTATPASTAPVRSRRPPDRFLAALAHETLSQRQLSASHDGVSRWKVASSAQNRDFQ